MKTILSDIFPYCDVCVTSSARYKSKEIFISKLQGLYFWKYDEENIQGRKK